MRQIFFAGFILLSIVIKAQQFSEVRPDTINLSKPPFYFTCLELGYDYDGLGAVLRFKLCNNTNKTIVNYGLVLYTYDAWGKAVNGLMHNTNKSIVNTQDCKIEPLTCGYYPCGKGEVFFPLGNSVSKVKMILTKIKYANGKVVILPVNKKYVYWVNSGKFEEVECEEE